MREKYCSLAKKVRLISQANRAMKVNTSGELLSNRAREINTIKFSPKVCLLANNLIFVAASLKMNDLRTH